MPQKTVKSAAVELALIIFLGVIALVAAFMSYRAVKFVQNIDQSVHTYSSINNTQWEDQEEKVRQLEEKLELLTVQHKTSAEELEKSVKELKSAANRTENKVDELKVADREIRNYVNDLNRVMSSEINKLKNP